MQVDQGEVSPRAVNRLLEAVTRVQGLCLAGAEPEPLFATLLNEFLDLSASTAGFIVEVLPPGEGGESSLHCLALSAAQEPAAAMAFNRLDSLYGTVWRTGQAVIANEPEGLNLPEGHLPLQRFLGIPIHHAQELIGIVGLADRAEAYTRSLVDFLQPLQQAAGQMIARHRVRQRKDDRHQKLQEAAATLRAILQEAVDGIVVSDRQGRIVSFNRAAERMFGYQASEVIGQNVKELMAAPDQAQHERYVRQYHQTGQGRLIGVGRRDRAQRKDGTLFPIDLALSEIKLADKVLYGAIIRDRTAIDQAEAELNRFKTTLDQTLDCVFMFDPQTLQFFYVNQGALDQLGYRREELLGMHPYDIKPEYDAASFRALISPLLAGDQPMLRLETLHRHKDGHDLPVEVSLQYIPGRGQPARCVAIVRDITERKQTEAQLRLQEERLRRSQIFANIGTWDWDIQTGELYWSERIGPLFGYEAGTLETTYENFLNAVHPEDRQRVIEAVKACVEQGAEYQIEHRCVWPDGTVRWLLERGDVVRDADGTPRHMLGVVQDITELKAAQQAMLAAKDEAERANKAKSDFLSSMSHELRTPLNAIMGFAQLMQYDPGLPDKHRADANEIYSAGQHLRTLIDEVLDFARIEAGRLRFSLEPVAVQRVLDESFNLTLPLAKTRGILLQCRTTGDEAAWVEADHTRLKQVLLNLISNAVKYNRDNGTVTLAVKRGEHRTLRISVRDSGIGIDAAGIAQLFQPFNRLGAEKGAIEGTGIGLTISKQLVEMMGGTLGVESEPGVGSVFWVDLKLCQQGAALPEQAPLPTAALTDRPRDVACRVLIVEDNDVNQAVLRSQLQLLGCATDSAADGAQAWERLNRQGYDLVLCDLHMPNLDGLGLIKLMRESPSELKDLPVIAVTANAMREDRKRCLRAGMNGFLTKPIDLKELQEALAKWVPGVRREERSVPAPLAAGGVAPEGLDRSVLRQLVGDDPARQQKILDRFRDSLAGIFTELKAALLERADEDIIFLAHKLKSSAAVVGARRLAQLCQAIEQAGNRGEWGNIDQTLAALQECVSQLGAALQTATATPASIPSAADRAGPVKSALVVDDDPVILDVFTSALGDLGVEEIRVTESAGHALEIIQTRAAPFDVIICDLKMPEMDGVEFLRQLASLRYAGAIVLVSGTDARILRTAEELARAHRLAVVDSIDKPVLPEKLARVLGKVPRARVASNLRVEEKISLSEIQLALEADQFVVHFQPKVDIDTGAVLGAEALARWDHPDYGMLGPHAFIPVAEQHGLIDRLTEVVLEKSLQQLAQWQRQDLALKISVNISADTLGRRLDLPDMITRTLDEMVLGSQAIMLEITESGLMQDIAASLDTLVRLRLKGFELSIDDFGTGYSTLKQLKGIPFSELKIDRSFVSGAGQDPSARAILETSVELARKLNMNIVAEGVETAEDWQLVKKLGCHIVQGFFVAKPMPGAQFVEWKQGWERRFVAGTL